MASASSNSRLSENNKPTRTGRPRGSNKGETLARLLPAARKLFAEKGFAQTTFKDVGKAVGMSHAALYAYFPAKLDLYLATLADTQQVLMPRYTEAIEHAASLREAITAILLASADAHDNDATITGFLAAVPIEMRRHPELIEPLTTQNNAVLVALTNLLENAQLSGELKSQASAMDMFNAVLGSGVGVALFQYGLQAGSLRNSMQVLVEIIEGQFFRH
ncbi:TetR family transcriptional regulator [Sinobacterium caligoides]|uniref:TetR family transcriptional regulator n=2 Tax=Sinobacterium caligoides TaxID=933926 RepID=A0A3N2DPN0_9GAMM|nr:TetR family transcriptional regulator [Sinobacterium caligoides]